MSQRRSNERGRGAPALLGLGLSVASLTLFRAAAGIPGVATSPGLATVSAIGYTGFLAGPPIVGGLAELTSLRLASCERDPSRRFWRKVRSL